MKKVDENPEDRYLRLAAQGNKQAYGMLYTQYLDEIYRFVFFKVGSKPSAEDLTEETFLRAWENLAKIYQKEQKIKNLRAWLYRIANNLVIDYYRKIKPVQNIDVEPTQPANTPLPEATAIKHEESHQLAQSIRKLKTDFQQVIILRLINDLPHKEVASIMHISETHSRVLLFRALKKLRELLVTNGGENA